MDLPGETGAVTGDLEQVEEDRAKRPVSRRMDEEAVPFAAVAAALHVPGRSVEELVGVHLGREDVRGAEEVGSVLVVAFVRKLGQVGVLLYRVQAVVLEGVEGLGAQITTSAGLGAAACG